MNVLVYDIAASESGALSVLRDFYEEVKEKKPQNINWFFAVSTPVFENTDNITVLRYPGIKKGWKHRISFELFSINKILKENDIQMVLSLQNIRILRTKLPQIVYMHNSVPFSDYRFKLKENKLMWVYQNLIAKLIFSSLKKSNYAIVQAEWIRSICIEKLSLDPTKIMAIKPNITISKKGSYQYNEETCSRFFYPAMAFDYKNFDVIVESCCELKEKGYQNYEVLFTLDKDENDVTRNLYKKVTEFKVPIKFVGRLTREEVVETYAKSVLLFPSFIESSPLPLSEGAICGMLIFAADYAYAHDCLNNYKNAHYFNPNKASSLTNLLMNCMDMKIKMKESIDVEVKKTTLLDGFNKIIESEMR